MQKHFYRDLLIVSVQVLLLAACSISQPQVIRREPARPGEAEMTRSPKDNFPKFAEAEIKTPVAETKPPEVADFDWIPEPDSQPATPPSVPPPTPADAADDGFGELAPLTPPASQVTERFLILPDVSNVDKRLGLYAEKISRWDPLTEQFVALSLTERKPADWDQCLSLTKQTFEGYSLLMELVLKAKESPVDLSEVTVDPWKVYQMDLNYLESGCDNVFMAGAGLVSGWLDRYSDSAVEQTESVVGRYAEKGQFQDAVVAYQNMLADYPDTKASFETRKIYGLALMRTGKLEAACDVLDELLEEMKIGQDERTLRRIVADLQLAVGRFDRAMANYRKLNDFFTSRRGDDRWVAEQVALLEGVEETSAELPLFQKVLESFIVFDGRHMPHAMEENVDKLVGAFPASPFSYRAQVMLREIEDEVRGWFGNRLVEVDELVYNKEYAKAMEILEDVLAEELSPGMRDVAQKTMDDVVMARAQEEELQRQILQESQASIWQKGASFFDLQKYDEAISTFSALLGTEYDSQAREKIISAVNHAATEMRRQAASLFVKARKSTDYDQKKGLFLESWNLLKQILEKYPTAEIINKVQQNLKILEEQFRIFDPVLFEQVTTPPVSQEVESPRANDGGTQENIVLY